jgi:hypothetical protein
MSGPKRRAVEAEMALHYGAGPPLLAATLVGWGRQPVARGLAESRTGCRCRGAPAACSGRQRGEEQQQQAAAALRHRAAAPAQPDPTFRTRCTSPRRTAHAAWQARSEQGESAEPLPAPRPMAEVLHRLGLRWRQGVKAKPHKKRKETAAIGDNRKKS